MGFLLSSTGAYNNLSTSLSGLVAASNSKIFGEKYLVCVRFAYDGEWKFADLLTMTAGKLAVKFLVDRCHCDTVTTLF